MKAAKLLKILARTELDNASEIIPSLFSLFKNYSDIKLDPLGIIDSALFYLPYVVAKKAYFAAYTVFYLHGMLSLLSVLYLYGVLLLAWYQARNKA